MKKTLLVSAVAMAVSGNAMAAEMYGNIRVELQSAAEMEINSGKLVLGAKGSNDLDNGMTVSYQLEMEHDNADYQTTGWKNDKSYVAIAGGFGKFIAGRHGDMAGWACGGTDILTIGAAEACSLSHNTEPDNAIQYRISSGMFDFGFAYTADSGAAGTSNNTLVGVQFSGENWSIGAQAASRDDLDGGLGAGADAGTSVFASGAVAVGDTGTQIGGTWQLGNIGLGLTYGDNGSDTDSSGIGIGLYMPLAGGNLAIIADSLDTVDSDSQDVEWSKQLGGGAYWGATWNSHDAAADDTISLWIGTNF